MSHQEKNYEEPEEEMLPTTTPFTIPLHIRCGVGAVSIILIAVCIFLVSKYIGAPTTYASPKDLGLTSVFLFSITILIVVWIPWSRLGVRITKIGGIEFEKIVTQQASEHAEEISYLEDRIEVLEGHVRKSNGMIELEEHFAEPKVRELLLEFLLKYSRWSFSPSRIRAWGSQQQGFSALGEYEHQQIRTVLQKMVSENELETKISNKGNTLYRIARP